MSFTPIVIGDELKHHVVPKDMKYRLSTLESAYWQMKLFVTNTVVPRVNQLQNVIEEQNRVIMDLKMQLNPPPQEINYDLGYEDLFPESEFCCEINI